MPAGGGVEMRVDVSEWMASAAKIGVAAKLLGPAAAAEARVEAHVLANRARTAALNTPLSGGVDGHTGLRQGISAGIQVRMIPKGAEVSSRGFLARQYNQPAWRHPVFGNDVWVTQLGYPYWSQTFDGAEAVVAPAFAAAVLAALRL